MKKLYVMGDFHIGNQNYRRDLLKSTLNKIGEDGIIIGMGDYHEFINEKSFKYDTQTMSPKKQFKEFKELMKPFAENGQIKTLLKGNHEDRYWKKLDGLEEYCDQYGIDYNGRHMLIKYGKYYIYAHHPKTSATTTAGRSTVFRKMIATQEADIYLTGHFHSLFQEEKWRLNRQRKLVSLGLFGCTGSYLEYANSYAELKLYSPNPMGCKLITIDPKGIKMEDFI